MRVVLEMLAVLRGSVRVNADMVFEKGLHIVHGPVGSGKSTLALVIAGLYPPSEGSVRREGILSSSLLLQFPEYHVTGSTLAEECASWGIDPGTTLSSAGMAERAGERPLLLSRGELKRLQLACVFGRAGDLLLLDEPFSALDCGQKEALCCSLSGRTAGITILFTHEREILPERASYFEIHNGTLVRSDGPSHGSGPGEWHGRDRLMGGNIP